MGEVLRIGRRQLMLTAALAVAVPMLAVGTIGAAAQTTLTVMAGPQEFTEAMIADFEAKNPDIKVNLILHDPTRLNTMLAAGNPPDIATGAAVASANINARGLATDLTPYLAASTVLKEDDLAPVNDSFRWDGTQSGQGPIYGIVKDFSQDATLWYNTALFDAAGVPYLSETEAITYDELLEIAKKLTVSNGGTTTVYGAGLEWAWNLYGPISAMVMQQGGSLFNDELTEINLTSPEARKAFQWYVDFAKAGVGPTSLDPLPDVSDYGTFAAGRMAITQDGYWFGGNFASDEAMQTVKMAPAPVMGDTRASPTYAGMGWWIPEQAKNKDAAWKVMEYFMAGPPAVTRAESGWGLPGLTSLMSQLPQGKPWQKAAHGTALNELQYSVPLPDSPYISSDLINATLDKYLQAAIKGEMSVDDATAAAQEELNKVLAQGKDQIG
jgi:multiple sugar transport system substrate-binding protein